MSDRKLTPNFRRRNFAATSLSLQSTAEAAEEEEELMASTRMMSLDDPNEFEALDNFEMETPTESRTDLEILSPIKLSMLSTQLLASSPPHRGFTAAPPEDVRLTSSLKGSSGCVSDNNCTKSAAVNDVAGRRPRKVVEFVNFEDNDPTVKKRTDSAGGSTDAAIQAKIFAEIKK